MKLRRMAEAADSRFQPSGMLEFERVSIASARAVAAQLPSGVENMLDRVPGYWHKVRRPQSKRDFVLVPLTMEWMRTLPKDIWPLQTGAAYPRVLNRIAQAWANADEREVVFDDLLNNRRRNRRGFPTEVHQELQALRLFSLALADA